MMSSQIDNPSTRCESPSTTNETFITTRIIQNRRKRKSLERRLLFRYIQKHRARKRDGVDVAGNDVPRRIGRRPKHTGIQFVVNPDGTV